MNRRWGVTLVVLTLSLASAPLAAQGRGGDPLSRLLLEAATLESRGDLDGAEAALRRLLEMDPTSTGAIFALERVLRAKNQSRALRPIVDAYLARASDPEVRALKLQLLVEADSVQTMVGEAERWLTSEPREQTFAAVAAVYERALGPERALEVLRRGRDRLGGDALALQTGDLLASQGSIDAAVAEWARAVSEDGSGMEAVRYRIERLGADRTRAARLLVARLGDSALPERRRATLRLALDVGLEQEALALARRHSDSLNGRAKVTFLNEIGIVARESGMGAVATWAYAELGTVASSPEERRQFDQRIVEISLEVGDTVAALAAQRRVVASYSRRSDEWRSAAAETIRLQATVEPREVADAWRSFRAEHPTAPELDRVGAAVSWRLQARGDVAGATAALEGIDGPRSSLERAYLALDRGDLEGGRSALMRSVGGLPPSEATPLIQLVGLLGRLSDPAKRALASAVVAAHRGAPAEAAGKLAADARELGPQDGAPLLAEAARMAEAAGARDRAAEIRRGLLQTHPGAPEVAEATLALARYAAGGEGDPAEAIRMLEDLITTRPNAAVVPEARLELQRLRNRGS